MRIALTNYYIHYFTGSEVAIYDFAEALQKKGHDVCVFTEEVGLPLIKEFSVLGITVFNINTDHISVKDFDVVISQHRVVLEKMIKAGITFTKSILFSLSPYEKLEKIPPYADLFSAIYANSDETKLIREGESKQKINLFYNSVKDSFFNNIKIDVAKKINRIAIVGNTQFIDQELFSNAFLKEGITPTYFGEKESEYKMITEKDLIDFDVVLTIGRTVQYCFAQQIPVYCYGRFGGPGYIDQENFTKNKALNFSGRTEPLDKKRIGQALLQKFPYEDIVLDITQGYEESLNNLEYLNLQAQEYFSLEKNLDRLLENLEASTEKTSISLLRLKLYLTLKGRILYFFNSLRRIFDLFTLAKLRKLLSLLNLARAIRSLKRATGIENKMKLGISYNLFDGEELIRSSILAIRESVSHINVVYQDVSNHGNKVKTDIKSILEDLKKEGLIDCYYKYSPDLKKDPPRNEVEKRSIGLKLAKKAGCSHFLNLDTDEYYDRVKFEQCKDFIMNNNIQSSACPIVSYLREPIYQIEGIRDAYVCFICKIKRTSKMQLNQYFPVLVNPTRSLNGTGKFKLFSKEEVVMDDMGLVRKDLDQKFKNSSANFAGNDSFFELWENTLSWEFPNDFRYNSKSSYLKITKVPNKYQIPRF